jgi:phosphatidylinositol-3-phosphatase
MSITRFLTNRIVAALLLPAFFGSLAFSSASAATSSSKTFRPIADAAVKQASATSNFGKAASLLARSAPVMRSYMRFTVSGLGGQPVQRARLLVYATSNSPARLRARRVANNSWSETKITYRNAPAAGTVIAASSPISTGSWVSLNVTHYIRGAGTYTFVVDTRGSAAIDFDSRESGGTAPKLIVDTGASAPSPSPTSAIKHVFVIVMENKGYSQVWNRSSTPYATQLGNRFAVATNYHALTHPSLPNYLDLYAGSKYGIHNDCSPSSSCHVNARNLADNLDAKGLKWKAYMESMPSSCYLKSSGGYAPKHNPFVYFDDIRNNATRCKSHIVPFSAFAGDLASLPTTPNYAFISPNQCNDTHDCSVSTGDNWLKAHVPPILNSAACKLQKCLVILTWDEDDGGSSNHVLTIFAGPGAKQGATSSVSYTHYSLLRTVESIFGLPAQTSNDASANAMSDMLR